MQAVRTHTRAELEQAAREQYRQRYAREDEAAEPRVINVRASLNAPRSFVWGGLGYWAPPLSYESGLRLLIVANAIRDHLGAGDDDAAHRVATTAARLIRKSLRSRRPFWWLTRAFYRSQPEQVETIARWLLCVEDDAVAAPNGRPVTVDLIDNRYAFEHAYKRRPESWADYVYGMRHIGRASSREDLRFAVATRMGVNATEEIWRSYERDQRAHAGWN
jgi:hypothetical protein